MSIEEWLSFCSFREAIVPNNNDSRYPLHKIQQREMVLISKRKKHLQREYRRKDLKPARLT
jgi:hypothetical protein